MFSQLAKRSASQRLFERVGKFLTVISPASAARVRCRTMGSNRSHNRRWRPQARGPRKTIEKDKYTICLGLGDSIQARLEVRLEGSTHANEKSFN